MEDIKLVVWDLDNTLWKGTLSEDGATIISEHIDIVKVLAARGILSSVSSKNDYAIAKKQLELVGLWDFIIFPHINWNPKGQEVKLIITECQLRAENVLFIDDNISNRKEVEFYNKGINTAAEDIIGHLLQMQELNGKNDSSFSRLKQYKLLEKKKTVRESYTDNRQFLKDSQIKIRFIRDLFPHKERILELINRTNQLNFTKLRIDDNVLDNLLNCESIENVAVSVTDKYGDYGICGFYSYDKANHSLIHYLFSCRILNLGIEIYIYRKLKQPLLKIIEPVSGNLDDYDDIDWIEEIDENNSDESYNHIHNRKRKMLILGGCDLLQMCHYIDEWRFNVIKEFNYVTKQNISVHKEHTVFLKDALYCTNCEKDEIYNLPFGDTKMFNTNLFSGDYDILVYSVLMNYTQIVYRRKDASYRVARGGYKEIGEKPNWTYLTSDGQINQEEWIYEGQQSPEDFRNDLQWLYDHVKTPIIFINGAETPVLNKKEIGAMERHVVMNKVLDEFIEAHKERCSLLDVRQLVRSVEDNTDSIRHYQRHIYVKMAEMLMSLVSGANISVSKKTIIWNKYKSLCSVINRYLYGLLRSKN